MNEIGSTLGSIDVGAVRDFLALGGPVVAVLLVLSVVVVAIAVAKTWQFRAARIGNQREARDILRHGRARRTGVAPRSLTGEVVLAALAARESGDAEAARDAAESYAALALHRLHRYTGVLDTIAQIAPLLGLFGTVLGMIEAFQALEGAGAAVDPSILAGGIWVALLTTAVGLAVAMPASLLAGWFDGRLEDERVALDALITELFTGPREAQALDRYGVAPHVLAPGRA